MRFPSSIRWWALGFLAVPLLTIGLDAAVLNVALPTLATDLHASISELQWFIDAYTLAVAASVMPAGLLGDRFGEKKLLLGSFAFFGLTSIGCAYSNSPGQLIATRTVLGVAAAFMIPLSLSLVTVLFPVEERRKAISVWAAAMAVGIPLGPVLGGWLLDHFWWGSVFMINVPLTLIGMVALAIVLPRTDGSRGVTVGVTNVCLSSGGLVALSYGLIEAGDRGWLSTSALPPMLGGLILLTLFVTRQGRSAKPLVDADLFRSRVFTWGSILGTLAAFGLMGGMFVLPQYFQAVTGTDALETGLRVLPIVGGLIVGVQIAEKLDAALGARVIISAGFGLMAVGLALGSLTVVPSSYAFAAVWISIVGLGLGFSMAPALHLALESLTSKNSGVGSAFIQAMRQVGSTLGVAVLGSVLNVSYRSEVDVSNLPPTIAETVRGSAAAGVQVAETGAGTTVLRSVRQAFVMGMDQALLVAAGVMLIATVLSIAFLPRPAGTRKPADAELELAAR